MPHGIISFERIEMYHSQIPGTDVVNNGANITSRTSGWFITWGLLDRVDNQTDYLRNILIKGKHIWQQVLSFQTLQTAPAPPRRRRWTWRRWARSSTWTRWSCRRCSRHSRSSIKRLLYLSHKWLFKSSSKPRTKCIIESLWFFNILEK